MKSLLAALFLVLPLTESHAAVSVSLELGPVWQSRNDVRIPSNGGTPFSIAAASSGPFFRGRLYASVALSERNELRLLIAPLSITAETTFVRDVDFAGKTFTAGTPVQASYKFNSYRLSYRYLFYRGEDWRFQIGFTAKVRDANIALVQGTTNANSDNIGFVPLLNFSARYQLAPDWFLLFDLDGLAAPQGRAFDGTLQAGWQISPSYDVYFGYRTLEGGARNSTVSTFAWLHYAVLGGTARF